MIIFTVHKQNTNRLGNNRVQWIKYQDKSKIRSKVLVSSMGNSRISTAAMVGLTLDFKISVVACRLAERRGEEVEKRKRKPLGKKQGREGL